MSSKSLKTRLAFIFSLIFICFTLVLFAFTYQLLGGTLERSDEDRFHQLVLRFWALYETLGDELLSEDVFRSEFLDDNQALVRLADRNGDTILLYFPEHFGVFDITTIESVGKSLALRNSNGIPENRAVRTLLVDRADSRYLETMTLTLPDDRIFQLGLEVTGRMTVLKEYRLLFPVITIPFLVLSILGGLLFSRNTLRPIGSLTRTTRSIIETGKLDARISDRGSAEELEQLVVLFNRMMEKIESLVNGMRSALDNVAHDLRTPITRLRGRAETALRELSAEGMDRPVAPGSDGSPAEGTGSGAQAGNSPTAGRALRECIEEAERIQSMLSLLMDISEAETGYMKLTMETVDLSSVLGDMAELYEYAAEDKGLSITTGIEPGLTVTADENRLRQVIANLLDNAVKYTPKGGRVVVKGLRRGGSDRSGGNRGEKSVRIEIVDTGPGIPSEELPLIWNRLFRGDRSRSEPGLGLGLSLVKAVVEAHGGSVGVESETGGGSRFFADFPADSITSM